MKGGTVPWAPGASARQRVERVLSRTNLRARHCGRRAACCSRRAGAVIDGWLTVSSYCYGALAEEGEEEKELHTAVCLLVGLWVRRCGSARHCPVIPFHCWHSRAERYWYCNDRISTAPPCPVWLLADVFLNSRVPRRAALAVQSVTPLMTGRREAAASPTVAGGSETAVTSIEWAAVQQRPEAWRWCFVDLAASSLFYRWPIFLPSIPSNEER